MTNTIRVERARKRISQEKLADAVGVTTQTIHALENGKYLPALLLACKIAFYFGKRVDEIFISEPADVEDIDRAKGKIA